MMIIIILSYDNHHIFIWSSYMTIIILSYDAAHIVIWQSSSWTHEQDAKQLHGETLLHLSFTRLPSEINSFAGLSFIHLANSEYHLDLMPLCVTFSIFTQPNPNYCICQLNILSLTPQWHSSHSVPMRLKATQPNSHNTISTCRSVPTFPDIRRHLDLQTE